MLGLPLAFTAPAALAALILLAGLYLLLRVTPPRPRRETFPPLRLLLGLDPKDQTPAQTPWPLLLLRLAIAAAIILAMAGPIWNAVKSLAGGSQPLLVIVDNGWPSAPSWDRRVALARRELDEAAKEGRLAALAATAQGGGDIAFADAAGNDEKLRALAPAPYAPDRAATLAPALRFLAANPATQVLWIADGLELGGAGAFAAALAGAKGEHAIAVLTDKTGPLALAGARHMRLQRSGEIFRAGANARARSPPRARSTPRARRSARRRSISPAPTALWRISICRSNCATKSQASPSPTSARPARSA